MAKFLTGTDLTETIEKIIWEAKENLLLVSPFVKLDGFFKDDLFKHHKNNNRLHILIVFGKNENNPGKSFNREDIEYFKAFPNISIVYTPDLHGKYYGNEKSGILTSINLYDYSFKNNIEFGYYSESGILSGPAKEDKEAWKTCWDIAENNEAFFIKRPAYKKKIFGKEFVTSEILYDQTENLYKASVFQSKKEKKTISDFPEELEFTEENKERPKRKDTGYCIRTGVEIPYNPKKPYSSKGWSQWQNDGGESYYKEKYCHRTGKPSYGKTSFDKPEL